MFSYEELKARIEHEKNSLRFYVLYWHILKKDMSEEELERMIDFHLDRLIERLTGSSRKRASQRNFTILNILDMASYKELNEELEQMKAEFLTLHSEEEEREFGEKMERFVASKSPEDRKILAQAFVNGAKESCERAEKLYDETLRVYLEGIYESISWSYVARHYFGKSRSWLCQRINGLKIRNKEVQFTENEKKILLDALLDLSNNIKRTALVIGHL